MKRSGQLADGGVCVDQLIFRRKHHLSVYGLLRCFPALLAQDHREIVGRDAEQVGIEGNVAVLHVVLQHQVVKTDAEPVGVAALIVLGRVAEALLPLLEILQGESMEQVGHDALPVRILCVFAYAAKQGHPRCQSLEQRQDGFGIHAVEEFLGYGIRRLVGQVGVEDAIEYLEVFCRP